MTNWGPPRYIVGRFEGFYACGVALLTYRESDRLSPSQQVGVVRLDVAL